MTFSSWDTLSEDSGRDHGTELIGESGKGGIICEESAFNDGLGSDFALLFLTEEERF
jgi:hypothetical protein